MTSSNYLPPPTNQIHNKGGSKIQYLIVFSLCLYETRKVTKIPQNPKPLPTTQNIVIIPTLNLQTSGQHSVGCPQILMQHYLQLLFVFLSRFLHLKSENAPCRGYNENKQEMGKHIFNNVCMEVAPYWHILSPCFCKLNPRAPTSILFKLTG